MKELPSLEIMIPVLNEEIALPICVEKLVDFCDRFMSSYDWTITAVDNGSEDNTLQIATALSEKHFKVRFIRLEQKGRGRALRHAWGTSKSDLVAYMDVDLSTDLMALPEATAIVKMGDYDIAIGSRLVRGSDVIGRSWKRSLISHCYSFLFRFMFFVSFRDAQCGFKVVSRSVIDDILPLTRSTGWFFDTELLLIASDNGYQICEIPVKWTDDPDTRVKIFSTALEDIKGLLRLRFGGLNRVKRILSRR